MHLAITPEYESSGAAFTYNAASELSTITTIGASEEALAYGGTGQDDLTSIGSTTIQSSLPGLTQEPPAPPPESSVEGMYEYPEDAVACSYTGVVGGICEAYLHPKETE